MINVLHICNEVGLGGTERGIIAMCRVMRYGLFEHSVLCLMQPGARSSELAGLATVAVDAEPSSGELERMLRSNDFQVVLVHRAGGAEARWSSVMTTCRKAAIPLVIEVNIFGLVDTSAQDEIIDIHLHISKSSYCNFRRRAQATGYPRVLRHRVLHIPTDVKRFAQAAVDPDGKARLRKKFDLGPRDFVLLRTGRPDFRKWGDLLLEAMPRLARSIPEARFVFLSAPATRAWYMARKAFSGSVRVLPPTTDDTILEEAYAMADVYFHSSRRGESFGVSLVEAMAAGLPVVVDSTPWRDNAQVEVVDHGQTGIVANSPTSFAHAIEHLHAHPDESAEMGRRGQQKALATYDAEVVCRSLAALIGEGLRSKNALHDDSPHLTGRIEPDMQEIDVYWKIERARRDNEGWESIPPRHLAAGLRQLAWAPLDLCEVLAMSLRS